MTFRLWRWPSNVEEGERKSRHVCATFQKSWLISSPRYISCCLALVEGDMGSSEITREEFWDNISHLSQDPMLDVRIGVARLIGLICGKKSRHSQSPESSLRLKFRVQRNIIPHFPHALKSSYTSSADSVRIPHETCAPSSRVSWLLRWCPSRRRTHSHPSYTLYSLDHRPRHQPRMI